MSEGVDYSTARPSPQGLFAAGKRFVVRYGGAGSSDKWLTLGEANALTGAGLSIVANVESTARGLLGGYQIGYTQAAHAHAHFMSCGMPSDRPIYLSADWDVQPSEWATVRTALNGAADAIGRGQVGIYGGRRVIELAQETGAATHFWQTYAWSGDPTHWVSGTHIQQYHNGVRVAGGDCDLDRSMVPDFGQWGTHQGGSTMDTGEHIIQAWSQGNETTPNSTAVAPVTWRIRDEAWQRQVSTALASLSGPVPIVLTAAQIAGLADALRPALAGIVEEVIARTGLTVRPRG